MKISILLPYKENFSPDYPGAVSLFLKDTIPLSKFKKKIFIYGNTNYKRKLLKNYKNLEFKKYFFRSSSKSYLSKFLERLLQTYLAKKEIIKKVKHIHKTSTILLVNPLIEFVIIFTFIILFFFI